jgi:hypothetical protein
MTMDRWQKKVLELFIFSENSDQTLISNKKDQKSENLNSENHYK